MLGRVFGLRRRDVLENARRGVNSANQRAQMIWWSSIDSLSGLRKCCCNLCVRASDQGALHHMQIVVIRDRSKIPRLQRDGFAAFGGWHSDFKFCTGHMVKVNLQLILEVCFSV